MSDFFFIAAGPCICIPIIHRLEEDVSESLQMSTDGDVASANYGNALRSKGDVLHYGSLLSRASDELQRGVDEFTDYEARDENPTEAIGNMLEVAKVVFDVKHEGQQGQLYTHIMYTQYLYPINT